MHRFSYACVAPRPPGTAFIAGVSFAGAFIAASQNDATGMLLLLLFYTGRSLGPLPSEQIRNFASASRFAVRMYACCSAFVLLWDLSRCRVDNACRATPKIASLILGSALVLE